MLEKNSDVYTSEFGSPTESSEGTPESSNEDTDTETSELLSSTLDVHQLTREDCCDGSKLDFDNLVTAYGRQLKSLSGLNEAEAFSTKIAVSDMDIGDKYVSNPTFSIARWPADGFAESARCASIDESTPCMSPVEQLLEATPRWATTGPDFPRFETAPAELVDNADIPQTTLCALTLCQTPPGALVLRREEKQKPLSEIELQRQRKLRGAAYGASGGAVALGACGGAAGLTGGAVAGALVGLIPACFTFGLSIPFGAAIGGGAGLVAGTTVGGGTGLLAGGAAGYAFDSVKSSKLDSKLSKSD